MEHDAVQLTRRKLSRVVSITAAGLAATAFTTMPAIAATVSSAAPAAAVSGTTSGPQLIISTSSGNVYTVDPSSTDICQDQPAGNSAYSAKSPVTVLPDGSVWTAAWPEYSNLVKIGTYTPASVNWVTDKYPLGAAPVHYVAGLLAMNQTWGVATGYYSSTLMSVNFKTGELADIGDLPDSPADGMTWATNGDLLMAGTDDHIYRLPAAVLTSAMNGTYSDASDWLDLGKAVTPSTVKWYNPFSWSNSGADVYGLATGPDGTVYVATKTAGLFSLAPNNVARTADPSRALQLNPLRAFPSGNCGFSGGDIEGMTMTGETLFAPATTDAATSVSATLGTPVTGTIGSTLVQAPATVSAAANTLPPGVTLAPNGTLSGTPASAGTTTATIKICGTDTCVNRQVTFTVAAAPAPAPVTPPTPVTPPVTPPTPVAPPANTTPPPADPSMTMSGSVSAPISGTLPGSAAAAPSTFTVTDPTQLPPGVSIDSGGNLMGIPSKAGTYAIPVKACNATGCTAGTTTLTIGPDQSPCAQNPAAASTVAFRDTLAHLDYSVF
jgi:hypothetical protein